MNKPAKNRVATPPEVKAKPFTLSPIKAREELRELEWLYERTAISSEAYDAAKAKIIAALTEWSKV